jgi:hypothetical protein
MRNERLMLAMLVALAIVAAACGGPAAPPQPVGAPIDKEPKPTKAPTQTPIPTNTPKPTNTPRPTPTPTDTPTPETPESPKSDGFYTVGDEIAAGKWHSTGAGIDCYWARLDDQQEILDNHFGIAGGTVTILETDYEVEFTGCGTWEYVENAEPILQPDATKPKKDGFYTVGVEIAPGKWRSDGAGDDCYWARLDDHQEILDNHFGRAGGTVTVQETDYEVGFEDCGTWEYLEESPPAEAPSETSDMSEQEYVAAILEILPIYSDALARLDELSEGANVLDEEWKEDVAEVIAAMLLTGAQVRELEPPEKFADFHAEFVEAANHYDAAAYLMIEGIDEVDADKITKAGEEMRLGEAAIGRASEELEKLTE